VYWSTVSIEPESYMRILHVIRGLTNSSGTTHIVGPLSEQQARLGHDVGVYFVEKGTGPPVLPDPSLVVARSFPVTVLQGHPGVSIAFSRTIHETIRKFDLVHIHAIWNFPTCCAMWTAKRARIPYIVAPQGSLEPWAIAAGSWRRRAYARQIEGPLLNRATRLQALTQTEAVQFRAFGLRVPAVIIPNGVQAEWLKNERGNLAADLGLAAGTKTLLFLSRLHPKKGLDILLRAFAEFAREREDVALIIAGCDAGDGYGDVLRSIAGELGLGQRCRFLGEVRGENKARTLAGADAFILISHSEGLPIALLEAMASGVPVIITPGCNIPEVVSADAGLMVEPSPEATGAGLKRLFSDPDGMRRRGENGRRLVRCQFTWSGIAKRTIEVYEEMVQLTNNDRNLVSRITGNTIPLAGRRGQR
jgi:poly(glycerol-phosphate) alpha-glucosyltransferase